MNGKKTKTLEKILCTNFLTVGEKDCFGKNYWSQKRKNGSKLFESDSVCRGKRSPGMSRTVIIQFGRVGRLKKSTVSFAEEIAPAGKFKNYSLKQFATSFPSKDLHGQRKPVQKRYYIYG